MKKKNLPGGQTKFNERLIETMMLLAKEGKTDEQIAETIGIATSTLYLWKSKYKGLSEALRQAKDVADDLVEVALFQRAIGYRHGAVKFFYDKESGCVHSEPYTEVYPPDTAAATMWLKNRRPEEWKEKQEHAHTGTVTLAEIITQSQGKEEE